MGWFGDIVTAPFRAVGHVVGHVTGTTELAGSINNGANAGNRLANAIDAQRPTIEALQRSAATFVQDFKPVSELAVQLNANLPDLVQEGRALGMQLQQKVTSYIQLSLGLQAAVVAVEIGQVMQLRWILAELNNISLHLDETKQLLRISNNHFNLMNFTSWIVHDENINRKWLVDRSIEMDRSNVIRLGKSMQVIAQHTLTVVHPVNNQQLVNKCPSVHTAYIHGAESIDAILSLASNACILPLPELEHTYLRISNLRLFADRTNLPLINLGYRLSLDLIAIDNCLIKCGSLLSIGVFNDRGIQNVDAVLIANCVWQGAGPMIRTGRRVGSDDGFWIKSTVLQHVNVMSDDARPVLSLSAPVNVLLSDVQHIVNELSNESIFASIRHGQNCMFDNCTIRGECDIESQVVVIQNCKFETANKLVMESCDQVTFINCELTSYDLRLNFCDQVVFKNCRFSSVKIKFRNCGSVSFVNCELTEGISCNFTNSHESLLTFTNCRYGRALQDLSTAVIDQVQSHACFRVTLYEGLIFVNRACYNFMLPLVYVRNQVQLLDH